MPPIQSRHISHADHDPETNTLTVRFHDGTEYEYEDVSPDLYAGLLSADSASGFFRAYIKGRHLYQRVV